MWKNIKVINLIQNLFISFLKRDKTNRSDEQESNAEHYDANNADKYLLVVAAPRNFVVKQAQTSFQAAELFVVCFLFILLFLIFVMKLFDSYLYNCVYCNVK